MPTYDQCSCCCASNCDSCVECDGPTKCDTIDLDVCLSRPDDLPISGCNSPPTKAYYDNDLSGAFTRSIGACLTFDGQPCQGSSFAKLRSDTDVYWTVKIKNDTTSCVTVRNYVTVSGLPAGCSVQISLVRIDSTEWDCEFAYPGTYGNGTVQYNGHCGDKCSEVTFCFAARVVGHCYPCKTATATLSAFQYDVRCPDSEDCTGVDDGCVSTWSCPECCECCQVDEAQVQAESGLTRHDPDILCCENQFYLLDSGYYTCNVDSIGECTPTPLARCSDNGPSGYTLDCKNNGSSSCVLTRTTISDALYLYPCSCAFTTPPDDTTCTPAGIYYKGADSDCGNQTEPCQGAYDEPCYSGGP